MRKVKIESDGDMFALVFTLFIFLLIIRLYYVLRILPWKQKKRYQPANTLIVLGSGGHTAEMCAIIKHLPIKKYSPRHFVVSDTDITSEWKVLQIPGTSTIDSYIHRIKRSRHVGQSYFTSVFSTIQSIFSSIPMVYRIQPDLILCNGPGTCAPICLIAFALKLFWLLDAQSKIVFVESFCRVQTVSLTGKILIWFIDCFVVQWPQLTQFSPKVKYFGKLI